MAYRLALPPSEGVHTGESVAFNHFGHALIDAASVLERQL